MAQHKNRGKGKMYMYQKANTPRHSNWIATAGFTASREADRQATSNSQKRGRVGKTLMYNYLYVFSSTVVSAIDRACRLQVCGHKCSRWCSVFALHTMGSSKVLCWHCWGRKMIVNHSHFRNNNRHLPAALPLPSAFAGHHRRQQSWQRGRFHQQDVVLVLPNRFQSLDHCVAGMLVYSSRTCRTGLMRTLASYSFGKKAVRSRSSEISSHELPLLSCKFSV